MSATPGGLRVLRAIERLTLERGYPPTVRELGDELDIASTNGVVCHLRALEEDGLIDRRRFTARAIVLTPAGHEVLDEANGTPRLHRGERRLTPLPEALRRQS